MGYDDTVALYGLRGTHTLTIPVPPGLVPSTLNALIEVPVGVRGGTLVVSQDDETISRTPLPTDFEAPVAIPLTGARVVDNALTVMLRSHLEPRDDYCLFDPETALRLGDTSVSFEGTETVPTTVADFLPPVLRNLTLYVPASPTRAESDAAIRLAASVAARYGKQNPDVTLVPLDRGQNAPTGPSLPMQRQILIREGDQSDVALQANGGIPSLTITGPANELTNQSRLMASDVGRLALSSKAVVGPLRSTAQLPPDVTTLRQLGQPGVNATALSPQVSLGLDQTRLGRPARDIRVHLRGSYTPLPSSVGGQLLAMIGGETIARWPTDGTGVIDRWVDVPNRLLQRYTNLGVAVEVTGNTGRCGEFQPVTLTIDGDSPIESTFAEPPEPGGFQALPQALMPRVQIGMDEGFDDTRRAVDIVVSLQRLSALPIDTAVTSRDEAISSTNPAVLINAGNWTDERVTLPVAANTDGTITVINGEGVEDQATLTLSPALRFGSLQTMYDGHRTLLVATSNDAPEQLDALLAWVNSDVARWSQLSGNAVVALPDRAPVVVSTEGQQRPADPTEQTVAPFWVLGAGMAALAVLAGGILIVRNRRRRTAP